MQGPLGLRSEGRTEGVPRARGGVGAVPGAGGSLRVQSGGVLGAGKEGGPGPGGAGEPGWWGCKTAQVTSQHHTGQLRGQRPSPGSAVAAPLASWSGHLKGASWGNHRLTLRAKNKAS